MKIMEVVLWDKIWQCNRLTSERVRRKDGMKKRQKIIALCALIIITLCACGLTNPSKKSESTNEESSEQHTFVSDTTQEILNKADSSATREQNAYQNRNINFDSFNCSEEIRNANWEEGKYQFFDMILPVGITYGELQDIVKSSEIEFWDDSPMPQINDGRLQPDAFFHFFLGEEGYGFTVYVCPPDLSQDSSIEYNEWIVVGYSISPDYEWGGNDYAWYPGGYSVSNLDWMPENEEDFYTLLKNWNLAEETGGSRSYHVTPGEISIYFSFDNCKIQDYYIGTSHLAYYQNGSKKFDIGCPSYTPELQDAPIYYLRDIFNGTVASSSIESTSNNNATLLTGDVYALEDTFSYDGCIGNVSQNEDGSYNILWSRLTVYSPKYITAAEIETLYAGMTYPLFVDESPYKCVEGEDSNYWYFIYSDYDSYKEAYQDGCDIYRIPRHSSADKEQLEYIFLEASDSYEPAYDITELENVTTIMAADATIFYLVDDYKSEEIPFEEIFHSDYTSIYKENDWTNSWRGFRSVIITKFKNGIITTLKERMMMG